MPDIQDQTRPLYVRLRISELAALRALAHIERRDPRDQAALLIVAQLNGKGLLRTNTTQDGRNGA